MKARKLLAVAMVAVIVLSTTIGAAPANTELGKLKKQAIELTKKLSTATKSNNNLNKKNTLLEKSNGQQAAAYVVMESKLNQAMKEKESITNKAAELQKQYVDTEAKLNDTTKEKESLTNKVVELQKKYADTETKLNDTTKEKESLTNKVIELQKQYADTETKLNDRTKEKQELSTKAIGLQNQLDECTNKLVATEKSLSELKSSYEKLVASANKINDGSWTEIGKLTADNSETIMDNVPFILKDEPIEALSLVDTTGKNISCSYSGTQSTLILNTKLVFGYSYTLKLFTAKGKYRQTIQMAEYPQLSKSEAQLIKIPANTAKGFNFAYYLYVPAGVTTSSTRMIVEPNNNGSPNDYIEVFDNNAKDIASKYPVNTVGNNLKIPVLVPVIPRPLSRGGGMLYTHDLNEQTMLWKGDELERIDLQLIAMIKDAQKILISNGINVQEKVFMTGYSASAKFVNKFSLLHPEIVRAVAGGGVNAMPMLPLAEYNGTKLNYALGINDMVDFTGQAFNPTEYKKLASFYYMGELDTNDATQFQDCYTLEKQKTLHSLFGDKMLPDRWTKIQEICKTLDYTMQFGTYHNVGHAYNNSITQDLTEFFRANLGDAPTKITLHE